MATSCANGGRSIGKSSTRAPSRHLSGMVSSCWWTTGRSKDWTRRSSSRSPPRLASSSSSRSSEDRATPAMEVLNVGIIGAGGIAQKLHLPDIAQTPGLRVTCLAGRKEQRLRSLAERFDVPHLTGDYQELLADDAIQGVVIALPHPLHVRWGLEALKAGKHILMQKPLCGDMAEADAFAEAVAATDRTVLCLPQFGDATYRARQ